MNKKGLIGTLAGILAFLIIVALIYSYIYLAYHSVDYVTITIKDKERINKDSNSYYLIFTENEVFKNTDSLLFLKFDSSDIYNQLERGHTYKVKVNWYRIKFLSEYRNILEVVE